MAVFADLVKAINRLPANMSLTEDNIRVLTPHLPEQFTFKSLVDEIQELKNTRPKTSLLLLLVCLKSQAKRQHEPDTDDANISILCNHAAAAIAPCSRTEVEQDADAAESEFDEVARRGVELAPYGLEVLQLFVEECGTLLSDETLFTLISFSDPWWLESSSSSSETELSEKPQEPFPWSTRETSSVARRVLELQLSTRSSSDELLVEAILKGYLRPLFSKSGPKTVTASGRKAEYADDEEDPHRGLRDESKEIKPWKYADHRALAVFQWAVETAQETLISKHWPLFTPVLTTLLADGATRVRWRGLYCLRVFLKKLTREILRDTGLDDVFEGAIYPALHQLPALTPEDESVALLVPAYAALRVLSRRLGGAAAAAARDQRLLDKILRDGVFSAYFYAKEYPRIVAVLADQVGWVVEAMGLRAVKHLKDLIPMFSEILSNPFANHVPRETCRAVVALQTIIKNCWPRLAATPAYQDELIKALVMCYLNMHDDEQASTEDVETQLEQAASMLSCAMKSGGNEGAALKDKVSPLIAREPVLANLFKGF